MLVLQLGAREAVGKMFDPKFIRDYRTLLDIYVNARGRRISSAFEETPAYRETPAHDYHIPQTFRVSQDYRFWSGVYPRYEDLIWGTILSFVIGVLLAEYRLWRERRGQIEKKTEEPANASAQGSSWFEEETLEVIEELTFEAVVRSQVFSKNGSPDDEAQRYYYDVITRSRMTKGRDRPIDMVDATQSARAVRRILVRVVRSGSQQTL